MRGDSILTDEEIQGWFKDHVATYKEYPEGESIREFLRWKQPGTANCFIDYIVKDGYLIVTGDLGDATYQWSPPISLECVAGYNLDYFHGKCQASEGGRCVDWYDWSERKAKKYIFEHFKDYQDCKGYKKFLNANVPMSDKDEYHTWLRNDILTGDATDFFGQDWCEWLPGVGNEIPIRCRAHLLGLKMAIRYLDKMS